MSFIANLLIEISNNTIPIAYVIILCGMLASLFQGLGKNKKIRNDFVLKEISPKVEEIKQKYPNEDEQLEKLNNLYKEYHFSVITPTILKIIGFALYFIFLITVFLGSNFNVDLCEKTIKFLTIENIFERTIVIGLPITIIILKIIALYIFIPKELVKIKDILITIISYALSIAIFSNVLAPTYSLFLLGHVIVELITNIPYNKKRRNLFYKYPPTEEDKQNESNKSIKEIFSNIEDAIK